MTDKLSLKADDYTICLSNFLRILYYGILEEKRAFESLDLLAMIVDGIHFECKEESVTFYADSKNAQDIAVFYKDYEKEKFFYDKENIRLETLISSEEGHIIRDINSYIKLRKVVYTNEKIEIMKDVFLVLNGPKSFIEYGNKQINVLTFMRMRMIPFSNASNLYSNIKDYELDLNGLPESFQNYLMEENETKINQNKKKLLLKTKK